MRTMKSTVERHEPRARQATSAVTIAMALGLLGTQLAGCERESDVLGEQTQARAELRQEQIAEQAKLGNEQSADIREQALNQQAARVAAEADAREESQAAAQRTQKACEGVPAELLSQCPVDPKRVQSVKNTEEGVALSMKTTAGSNDEIEKQVSCYQAGLAERTPEKSGTAPTMAGAAIPMPDVARRDVAPVECLLDLPGVRTTVAENGKRTTIELEVDEKQVPALRTWTDKLIVEARAPAKP
jgi:hypothetical protein